MTNIEKNLEDTTYIHIRGTFNRYCYFLIFVIENMSNILR